MIFSQSAFKHLQTTKFFSAQEDAKRRLGFFPTKDPRRLQNCKQYFWVHPDGGTTHAVYLNALERSFREEIAFQHYISHLVKTVRKSAIGYNILSRDQPWDFRVGFSSGSTINIEITSVTDREGFFKQLAAEELVQRHSYYSHVRLGILRKIAEMFPDDGLNALISALEIKGYSNSDDVQNPYFEGQPKLFTSPNILPLLDLEEELRNVIAKKQNKKHTGKNETVLIVDNQTTTANIYDFMRVAHNLNAFFDWVEFPEIWLFTGYGGGSNPRFEEALLLPLKLPEEIRKPFVLSK